MNYKSVMKAIFTLTLLLVITSCKSYSDTDKANFKKEISAHIEKGTIEYSETESGLFYHIDSLGTIGEKIQSQSIVSLNYKGTFLSGKVFDKTHVKKVMKSELKGLIRGFQEALLGKQVGTKMKLIVPPYLGYGDMQLDDIPQHSILCFDIEVVGIE